MGSEKFLEFQRNNDLVTVTDEESRSVRYRLDTDGRIVEFWGSDDSHFQYSYVNGLLSSVNFPDNTSVVYHYENSAFPTLLTGVTDQKGVRYASWGYDSKGRAILSEHAGGKERHTIDHSFATDSQNPRVIETNPFGKQTIYHFKWQDGRRLLTQVEGVASGNCVASNATYTYDENGYLDKVTDQEGNVTDYDHDEQGRLIKQVEALNTEVQRETSTLWVTFTIDGQSVDKPARVTEKTRITEYVYDEKGNLTNKVIKPLAAFQ